MSDYDILYPIRTCEFCGRTTNSRFRVCCEEGRRADGTRAAPLVELAPLLARLTHARAKHPEGASFDALVEEVGEVARARLDRSVDQERSELLDVAVVALRLYLGERAP